MGTLVVKVISAPHGLLLRPHTSASVALLPRTKLDDTSLGLIGGTPTSYWPGDSLPANMKHLGEGNYAIDTSLAPFRQADGFPQLEAGDWLLAVRDSGFTPVVQRLTFTLQGDELRVQPGWSKYPLDAGLSPLGRTASTIQISRHKKGAGDGLKPSDTLITVAPTPRLEVVNLNGGPDEHGTRFVVFAETRRSRLLKEEIIRPGNRVTFLDPEQGYLYTTVTARQGWMKVFRKAQRSTTASDSSKIGVVDLYDYLHHMGEEAPDSVVEVSVFSHSYREGPIVWNTYDASDDPIKRDPADADGRRKDFHPTNVALHASMPKALSPSSLFKIWGCRFEPHVVRRMRVALDRRKASTSPDELFEFESTTERYGHSRERTSINFVRRGVSLDFSSTPVYASAAATVFLCPCWSAPPGAGASFRNNQMLVFDDDAKDPFEYLVQEFGLHKSARDGGNYLNHSALVRDLRSSPVNRPAFVTDRWWKIPHYPFLLHGHQDKWSAVQLPSGHFLLKSGSERELLFKVESSTGVPEPRLPGHIYWAPDTVLDKVITAPQPMVILAPSSSKDAAGVFVQANGKAFLVVRRAGSAEWSVNQTPLLCSPVKSDSSGWWSLKETTKKAVGQLDGEMEW